MLGVVSEDENHNKTFKPMAGATLGQGVPLGAWCSFEKDVAPSSNWLMAGTTFDATKYPALNLYLGTNKVPSRYDHNRPSEWEEVTSTNTFTPVYDGVMIIGINNANIIVKMNDVEITRVDTGQITDTLIPFKKGDVITFFNIGGSAISKSFKVSYYTHPLFIKATSIASDSDKDSILAQIQAYNTYSTEETLTGETWIDGKPIYRKCGYPTGSFSLQNDSLVEVGFNWINTTVTPNISKIITVGFMQAPVSENDGALSYQIRNTKMTANGVKLLNIGTTSGINTNTLFVFEYTKTTD